MEKGGDEVPRIVQVMYFKQMPRPAVPQNGSQQPDTALPQQWETQWPEFLKTLQPAHVGWGNPPVMESAPWDDAKTFLSSFEEVAEACQWPREQWVGRLLPALRGGVKQCLWRLNARDRRDYEKVKSAVLRDDAIRTEAKRQHFRQCGYREGPRTVYSQLQELCRQWLKPDRRTKEQILELIVQEQLLAMLPQEVQRMVRECAPEDCIETVALAENFLMSCQGTRTWEQQDWGRPGSATTLSSLILQYISQVPVPEGTVGSLETEGALPNVARRQFCVGINQKGNGEIGLMANEITATRNSGVVLPPEGQEVAGAGQAEEPVDAKNMTLDNAGWTEEDLDQKPPRWDVVQQNSGNASTSDGLLIPTPDNVAQPEQQEAAFTQILENGETVPGSLLGGRVLSEIKTEDSEQSDVDVEGVPEEEHQSNVSKSPEPSTQRELRPRKPEEQQGRATRRRRRRAVFAKKASKCLPREKKYECPECGYRVAFLSDLLRHLKTHSGKRPYKCLECGKTFSRLDSFQSHQRIHIPTARADSSKKVLDDSLSSHQGAKQYVCSRCGFKAMALKELTEHMTVHRGERRYPCPECGKTFGWKSNLSRHRRLHLVRNDFGVRKLVHRGGEGPGKLKNHSLQHYRIKLEDVLGTSSGVAADAREPSVSSRLRPRKPQQESEFSFGALLDAASLSRPMSKFRSRKHQEKSRGGSCQLGRAAVAVKRSINYGKKKKHACQQCEYRSERLSDVVKHMRVHTKERPYNCLDCGVSFRWLSNYTEHKKRCTFSQRTPVPEAPVAECDVWLSDDEELINILQKNSQQQGTGSKASTNIVSSASKTGVVGTKSKQLPKEWRMQGKASRRQRNTVNMTTNKYRPKERKHECSECGHRTFYLSDLIRHLRVHTREKPYKCLQCGKAFAQQSTLTNHEKTHKSGGAPSSGKNDISKKASSLGEKNYTCSKCGHRTAKLAALLKHMRVHLGERPYKCEDCGETFAWHSILCRHQRIHKLDRAPSGRKTPVAGREEMSEGDNEAPSKMMEEKSQQDRTELKKTSTTSPEIAHGNISLTAGSGSSKEEKTAPKKEQTESIKGPEDRVAGKELVKRINLEMFAYSKGEKSCQSQSGLVTDPLISDKEKPHESSECEKSYSIKCSLMKFQHKEPEVLPEETEEKPYICSDCGECFSVKARLSRHQLKHTGVRPYICSECGHSYYRRDALMTHLKIHGLSMTKDAPSLAKDALGQSPDEASVKSDRTESS